MNERQRDFLETIRTRIAGHFIYANKGEAVDFAAALDDADDWLHEVLHDKPRPASYLDSARRDVAAELAALTQERDVLRGALVRACDYIETISRACPFDAVAGYECPRQEDCGDEMATCWREYFLARKALGLEDTNDR